MTNVFQRPERKVIKSFPEGADVSTHAAGKPKKIKRGKRGKLCPVNL